MLNDKKAAKPLGNVLSETDRILTASSGQRNKSAINSAQAEKSNITVKIIERHIFIQIQTRCAKINRGSIFPSLLFSKHGGEIDFKKLDTTKFEPSLM